MKKIKSKKISTIIMIGVLILAIIVALIVYSVKTKKQYNWALESKYNLAFYELIDSVQNAETYLAKAQISTSAKSGAENLSNVWREAGIAQASIAQLPLTSSEIGSTVKFLNQISDYAYSLSRKGMSGEKLSDEDMANIKQLYSYSVELENTLQQLAADFAEGRIKWNELTSTDTIEYATQVSSITAQNFENLDTNLHEYSGLIYDGAFSEHLNNVEKKGIIGDDIDEEEAKKIATTFYEEENIEKIESVTYSENADIPSFEIKVKLKDVEENASITVSKKGGRVISSNNNKEVEAEVISDEEANEKGKTFLEKHGYENMKETYFLKENGIMTINYAATQNTEEGREVVLYPDLIKLKIALDDGSILGLESTGYLNSHTERDLSGIKISEEEAMENLNNDTEIISAGLAVIPTKWKTEILCYEFKGRVEGNDFLVYINAENAKEEDILLIVNTPNGTLTH